ncbi:MAG: radical SAM protein, partial [Euryarchaeota archaeon]|nr:radical SAM protein [Euryarchaeota archaeon]
MQNNLKFTLLNLPNPPLRNIYRGFAGGFGTSGTISSEVLLPTYLLYGASAIETSGCEYDLLDAQVMEYDSSQVVSAVRKAEPNVLITWLSLPSIYDDLGVLSEIRQVVAPETLIVALGAVCNVMPEEVLGAGCVDLAVAGSYPHYNLISNIVRTFSDNPIDEETFGMIGGAVYRNGDDIVRSAVEPYDEDIDHLVLDVYHKIPVERYVSEFGMADGGTVGCIPIVTAVGCPHSCIYCPYPVGYGRKVQMKSIENIIDEIVFLKEGFGIGGFLFRDQNFTRSRKRVLSFCDAVVDHGLDVRWLIESRVDQVTEELLLRMREAGCFRIHYGVETGEPEMLEKTGKPGVGIEDVKRAFKTTKDAGIFTVAHMIIGLPGESKETLEHTFNILREINPDNVSLNVLTPYPGTKLFDMAMEQGWIRSEDWSLYNSF